MKVRTRVSTERMLVKLRRRGSLNISSDSGTSGKLEVESIRPRYLDQ